MRRRPPPHVYFVASAIFHYLGPAFAVLLFVRVDVLGVAWLRIASAALIFALWRRPWRAVGPAQRATHARLLLQWGAVLALMNCCFYVAIDRLPLGTVAAIEFLPVIALAALGARTPRNAAALALAVPGVYLLTGVRFEGEPLGVALAFANAGLFALYIVLAHRAARHPAITGIDGLGLSMLIAAVVVTPIAGWAVVPAAHRPDRDPGRHRRRRLVERHPLRRRPARHARAPARDLRADGQPPPRHRDRIGVVVLAQLPTAAELAGVALVIAGVALHRDRRRSPSRSLTVTTRILGSGSWGVS